MGVVRTNQQQKMWVLCLLEDADSDAMTGECVFYDGFHKLKKIAEVACNISKATWLEMVELLGII